MLVGGNGCEAGCIQTVPYSMADKTLCHPGVKTGAFAERFFRFWLTKQIIKTVNFTFHLSGPTGGTAYGIPKKCCTPFEMYPCTGPDGQRTVTLCVTADEKFVFLNRVKYLHALRDANCEEKTKDYRAQRDLVLIDHLSFRLTKQRNEPPSDWSLYF